MKSPAIKREDIASAIFDAVALYCVENGFHESITS